MGQVFSHARILLVDDYSDNLQLLSLMLRGAGYRYIDSLTNGADVVAKVLQYSPDIILLDLSMPRVDGFDVLLELQPRL